MEEEQKIQFYRTILDELAKSKATTQYCTAYTFAPQARVPQFLNKQKDGHLLFIAPLRRVDKLVKSLFFLCVCECGKWVILESYAYR